MNNDPCAYHVRFFVSEIGTRTGHQPMDQKGGIRREIGLAQLSRGDGKHVMDGIGDRGETKRL